MANYLSRFLMDAYLIISFMEIDLGVVKLSSTFLLHLFELGDRELQVRKECLNTWMENTNVIIFLCFFNELRYQIWLTADQRYYGEN